jgi:DNA-binding NarL/FixJ family response regulator
MDKPASSAPTARILIADDHLMFTETLRNTLAGTYTVVGVVTDGRSLVDEAARLKPDVVLVDVGMPLLNGYDAAVRIRKLLPDVKLVFLTMQDDRNLAAAALRLGSVGFVLKHSATSELLTAISEVMHGKSYVTPKLRSTDWADAEERAKRFEKDLTPRQREVLQLLAEGRTMKEVAFILKMSRKTVMFHKYQIMDKFNISNNADLVRFAMKNNLTFR